MKEKFEKYLTEDVDEAFFHQLLRKDKMKIQTKETFIDYVNLIKKKYTKLYKSAVSDVKKFNKKLDDFTENNYPSFFKVYKFIVNVLKFHMAEIDKHGIEIDEIDDFISSPKEVEQEIKSKANSQEITSLKLVAKKITELK